MMKHQGFTLLELLITLFIAALIFGLAIPQFSEQIKRNRTQAAAQNLLDAIETARTLAVMQNKRTLLVANGKWHEGWKLLIDLDNDGTEDPGEPIIKEAGAFKGIKITGNSPVQKYISFIATGEGRMAGKAKAGAFLTGTLRICPDRSGSGYKLVLSRGGRLRSEKLKPEECVGTP